LHQSARFFSESSKSETAEEAPKEEEKVTQETQEPPKAKAAESGPDDDSFLSDEIEKEGPELVPPEETKSREKELEEQVRQLKKQLMSSLAEQDNVRKIARNDVEAARQFAIKSFAKSLLDVADNFERALSHVPDDVKHDRERHPVLADLYEGIEMTQKNLLKAFEANGLVKFGEVGEAFDPQKHSAMFEFPDPTKEPGTVGQVVKAGYYINQRVLRPAEVGVVKKVD
jgi:molecular chaperone GrpE